MLDFIYDTINFIIFIISIYTAVISLFFIKKIKQQKGKKKLKYCFLIAARNEEACIGNLVRSINKQNYNKDLFKAVVMVNNTTDNTYNIAKENGAKVINVPFKVKNKAEALNYGIKILKEENDMPDAFIVLDADNIIKENYLKEMNKILSNKNVNVTVSKVQAKNRFDTWVSACYEIHFASLNLFSNKARVNAGLSARIIGTGLGIKAKFLESIGNFPTKTNGEDTELFVKCASIGEKVRYCDTAITYDEEPIDFKTSVIQRKRWTSILLDIIKVRYKDLINGLKNKKSLKYTLDVILQFSFTLLQAILPIIIFLLIIKYRNFNFVNISLSAIINLQLSSLLFLLFEKRFTFNKNIIIGIFMYPFFVFSFIFLQTFAFFFRTKDWVPIKHLGENKIQ